MPILNAHRRLREKYVDLILSAISIIQGLAFTHLMTKFSSVYDYSIETGDLVPFSHFVLCFIVLLRIYQTYITAALDYEQWNIRFVDLFLVFIVGGLEYFLFDSLSRMPLNIEQFYVRLMLIALFGGVGYIYTFFRLKMDLKLNTLEKTLVKKTQQTNFIVAFIIGSVSCLVVFSPKIAGYLIYEYILWIAIFCCAITVFNIHCSLYWAFDRNARQPLIDMEQTKTIQKQQELDHQIDNTKQGIGCAEQDPKQTSSLVLVALSIIYALVIVVRRSRE